MSLWFSASAVGAPLAARLAVSTHQAVWLTPMVQLGFVFGTAAAALLNPRRHSAVTAVLCDRGDLIGAARECSPLLADDELRGHAACCDSLPASRWRASHLAGDENGLDLVSPARRGLAIGTVVGALTVGKASPYLVHAFPSAGMTRRW